MGLYLCECRGPCRRSFQLDHAVYRYLRLMGTVVTAECADREHRDPVHRYRQSGVVVVNSNGPRRRPADHPSDSL